VQELCEAHDVKAVRQSPRGFAPAVAVSSSSLQLEPEIVPHSVGLGGEGMVVGKDMQEYSGIYIYMYIYIFDV
jgi:hypothetical protein